MIEKRTTKEIASFYEEIKNAFSPNTDLNKVWISEESLIKTLDTLTKQTRGKQLQVVFNSFKELLLKELESVKEE